MSPQATGQRKGGRRSLGVAGLALASALAALALGGSPLAQAAPGQCTADTDCKGERVCERGRCVDPQPAPARPAAPAQPAPARSGPAAPARPNLSVCADDSDCPADRLCVRGSCEPRPAPAAQSAPRAAPALPARATGCIDDTECPGELVCERNACVPMGAAPAAATVAGGAPAAQGRPAGAVIIEPDQRLHELATGSGKLRFRPPNLLSSSARRGGAR